MPQIFVLPRQVALDDDANPMAGALLYFFQTGTTAPQAVYSDIALTTSHSNPVVADSAGEWPKIYLDSNASANYRVRITTAAGVQLYQEDDVERRSSITTDDVGRALYRQTSIESGASVTPTAYSYPACDVRRYGGNPNGSVDATGALATAAVISAAGGGNVIVEGGTYRVTSNTTIARGATIEFRQGGKITVDTGMTLTITGTLRAPRTQIFTGSGTVTFGYGGGSATEVYPEWFGAIPDGTTDCSAAINKAIAAASGGEIVFAAGVYSCEGLNLQAQTSLRGTMKDETILKSRTATTLMTLNSATVAEALLTISNLTLDANSIGTIGLRVNNFSRFSVRDCKIQGFTAQGVYFHGALLSQLVRCEIKNCLVGFDADADQSPPNAIALRDCSIGGSQQFAIRLRQGAMIVIDGCDIENCGSAGNAATRAVDIADMDTTGLGIACVISNTWFEDNHGLSAINISPPDSNYSIHAIENCHIFGGTRTNGIAAGDGTPVKSLHLRNVVCQNAGTADFFVGTQTIGHMIGCRGSTKSISTDASVDFVLISDPVNGVYKLGKNLTLSATGHQSLTALPGSTTYANDAAAAAGGVAVGQLYRNGSVVQVRVS